GAHMKAEDFAKAFGASSDDIAAVRSFATQHGMAVVDEHAGRRTVVLSGTVKQFNEAFGVDLQQFEHPGGSYRGRTGPVQVPDELKDRVQAVLGLDNRPVPRPHFRRRPQQGNVHWQAEGGTFTPTQLAALYGFPDGDGSGQCAAIIELGGGYRTKDLTTYFGGLKLVHGPKVQAVSVDHGRNHATGDANGPDGEVMLDIEVVGAVAPKANIVVYFAPNTDAGFLNAITDAIHDTKYRPSVVSISWGGPQGNRTWKSFAICLNGLPDAGLIDSTGAHEQRAREDRHGSVRRLLGGPGRSTHRQCRAA
ncbi:MAG: protease pro-enzyme activation domain-containing protein, partial [Rhodopila sp.]